MAESVLDDDRKAEKETNDLSIDGKPSDFETAAETEERIAANARLEADKNKLRQLRNPRQFNEGLYVDKAPEPSAEVTNKEKGSEDRGELERTQAAKLVEKAEEERRTSDPKNKTAVPVVKPLKEPKSPEDELYEKAFRDLHIAENELEDYFAGALWGLIGPSKAYQEQAIKIKRLKDAAMVQETLKKVRDTDKVR